MNESAIKAILQANLVDEDVWRIVDPASSILLSHREDYHYMMIPSNSTPFGERPMAGPILWKLVQDSPTGAPSSSNIILRFPARDGGRLYPFLLELIEATGHDVLSSTIALEIAKEWEELWKKGGDRLSKEQQRGLFAELIVLRNLLEHEGPMALSMWKGPEGGLHDFVLESGSIEVKAHGKLSRLISVSRLNQLEPLNDSILQLCCVGLSRSEFGMSLGDLVEEVHNALPDDCQSRFINKLKEAKYNPDDAPLYSSKYVVLEIKMGIITCDSKTLHHGKLKVPNPALKDAIYKLDSSFLELELVTLEESFASKFHL
jgi:hypothetical protein